MFVYIKSAAFIIVVTQKLVLQQPKNVTAKCTETLMLLGPYNLFVLSLVSVQCTKKISKYQMPNYGVQTQYVSSRSTS